VSNEVTVAVDAMGGDNAPSVVIEGVDGALKEDKDLHVLLCGPAEIVEPFAAEHERCTARVTTEVISMEEHPANAVREKKDSSLVVGCKAVKEAEAQGFFSAGSTGACLAAGILVVGRIHGVQRPALLTVIPASKRPVLLTDVGANADCKPEYLLQFGQMATVFAEKIMGIEDPKAALLNIGEEETKGSQAALEAHEILKENLPNFVGNAEGGDIMNGSFDIIITDGFTGNVCLKTIEGTAKTMFSAIKDVLKSSAVRSLGGLMIKSGLKEVAGGLMADSIGGAPLLGVKGACVVGHGSSSSTAIKNGVLTTARMARLQVSEIIAQTV
jgi:glycerol-3-phosphate acyltransferase PlsX